MPSPVVTKLPSTFLIPSVTPLSPSKEDVRTQSVKLSPGVSEIFEDALRERSSDASISLMTYILELFDSIVIASFTMSGSSEPLITEARSDANAASSLPSIR